MTNAGNLLVKQKRRNLIKAFGGKCVFCGTTKNLVFAHRYPTPIIEARKEGKAGRKERLYDVIKHKKAYLLTCRKHNKLAEGCKKRVKIEMSYL